MITYLTKNHNPYFLYFIVPFIFFLNGAVHGQNSSFDKGLANELGADQYGMKKYVMALLYAGENQNLSQEEKVRLQKEHLKNIQKLATEGKLVLAGPFMDDKALRGIYIFDVPTIEEAEALTATDPAIQARSLKMELKPWYGSAALLRVNKVHEKIAQKQP
ncbi:hypothetical protein PEDI_12800 [Persicobacter diffluens]|uniref:YCII-related domain-containing protein n=2 Tax=Persicobacter diffluens TaxID=981 RepID=A0AAN4VW06_9BACT|nr:hypothetical protein PEDI_12800 [Persicobacter diffluens]